MKMTDEQMIEVGGLMSARDVSNGKRMIACTKRYSRMVNK